MNGTHWQGETVPCTDEFQQWRAETPELLALDHEAPGLDFEAVILEGGLGQDHGDGATLYWRDDVINEWAEWFPDLATALCRLAALLRAKETVGLLTHEAPGFVRWSENFFNQTVTGALVPREEG